MYTKIYSKEEYRLAIVSQLGGLRKKNRNRFQVIVELIQNLFKIPICMINIVDQETVWNKASVGLNMEEVHRPYSFCTHTIKNAQGLFIEDALKSEFFSRHPLVHSSPNIRFYAGLPIVVQNQPVGTLALLDYEPHMFLEVEKKQLQSFVQWVQIEFEYEFKTLNMPNCESCGSIEISENNKQQQIDLTTGLWNRVSCHQLVKRKLRRFLMLPKQERKPLSLLLIKLDDSTSNYTHKNQESVKEEILKYTAHAIQSAVRIHDVAGRYAENEFVVVMQDCELEECIKISERIRKNLENKPIKTSQGHFLTTLSVGVVCLLGHYSMLSAEYCEDQLFSQAEMALHSAELKGHNRFEVIVLE